MNDNFNNLQTDITLECNAKKRRGKKEPTHHGVLRIITGVLKPSLLLVVPYCQLPKQEKQKIISK